MRARWHKWWLVALASTACTLNPQPDLPGGEPGRGASNGSAGGAGVDTPPDTGTSTGGAGILTAPTTGDEGGVGEAGASGEAGATSDPPVVAR